MRNEALYKLAKQILELTEELERKELERVQLRLKLCRMARQQLARHVAEEAAEEKRWNAQRRKFPVPKMPVAK